MSRCVKEGNGAAVHLNGVCADMLGDAACLAGGNICMADIVKQRGFAVVNMTHNDNDRCAADKLIGTVLMVVNEAFLNGHNNFLLYLTAEFHCDQCRGIVIDNI